MRQTAGLVFCAVLVCAWVDSSVAAAGVAVSVGAPGCVSQAKHGGGQQADEHNGNKHCGALHILLGGRAGKTLAGLRPPIAVVLYAPPTSPRRGIRECFDEAEGCGPGEERPEESIAFGNGVSAAATVQIVMDSHEGGEPESGVDHPSDKGMGLGRGPAAGEGYGPLDAIFLGQPAEPDDSEFEGHLAAEGVDARSQGVHLSGLPHNTYLAVFI